MNEAEIIAEAYRVFRHEADALDAQSRHLNGHFVRAIRLLAACRGDVVTTGVGKSGVAAQRLAATLTASGTPAWFLSPADAMHGDIGRVRGRADVMIMMSKSGESSELFGIAEYCEKWDMPVILITARKSSTLATRATVILQHSPAEACRYDLTPSTSITLVGVLGDALALVLQMYHQFGPTQFAALHPGGSLGRVLSLSVDEVMLPREQVGIVSPTDTMQKVSIVLAHHRGIAVVEKDGHLKGVITAGDLTRTIEKVRTLSGVSAEQCMTRSPFVVVEDILLADAVRELEEKGLVAAPVLNQGAGQVIGVLHLHDALRALR